MKKATLPDLPYDYNALEPVVSAQIMELHHSKHHAGYVNNYNAAMEKVMELESKGETAELCASLQAVKFNGGGHANHEMFWESLAPQGKGGGEPPSGELAKALVDHFGSLEVFIEKFNTKVGPLQGSGWGWLGCAAGSRCLCIRTTANQDVAQTSGIVPLLGIDVWEHAYYLDYKNARPEYLKNIWKVVNWKKVEERFLKISG